MKVCSACGQENPDVAKFCLACGAPLEAPAPAPSAEERKLVTVLFTDIVGSTAKAEQMDPEDVRARLAPYYTRLRAELERHGGTVEKFIGDAVVALFGAPTAHEDDPERAVRAALAIRDAIEDLNAEDEWLDLQVRIGVNTGEALVVVGAKATEGEGMASGDVMNTAARLQSAAPVNGILVGALTYEATRDGIEYRDAEPIAAKGKSEPVQVWEVVGVVEATAEAVASEGVALVGREQEVAALAEACALVEAETVEHRGPTVGYRVEEEGQVLVYLPDHEPYLTAALDDEPRWISGWALASGADLLLHDSSTPTRSTRTGSAGVTRASLTQRRSRERRESAGSRCSTTTPCAPTARSRSSTTRSQRSSGTTRSRL
jgi:class 3 adenylate cyclase